MDVVSLLLCLRQVVRRGDKIYKIEDEEFKLSSISANQNGKDEGYEV